MTAKDDGYGVIFDMDGVLVDTARAHFESWKVVGRERGVEVTWEQFHRTFGRPNDVIIPRLFGDDLSAEEISEIDRRKEAAFREIFREELKALPGAVEMIEELHRRGFRLAVGSSAPPENIRMVLEELGVEDYFRSVVCAADVEHGKPDPEVFLKAAEALGVEPENCLVIEDVPAGVEAAHRAGMACIALSTSHAAEALSEAELMAGDLSEVPPERVAELAGKAKGKRGTAN
ncbi:MAG: HAD family hydrolase [Planctomycetota bacterium]